MIQLYGVLGNGGEGNEERGEGGEREGGGKQRKRRKPLRRWIKNGKNKALGNLAFWCSINPTLAEEKNQDRQIDRPTGTQTDK